MLRAGSSTTKPTRSLASHDRHGRVAGAGAGIVAATAAARCASRGPPACAPACAPRARQRVCGMSRRPLRHRLRQAGGGAPAGQAALPDGDGAGASARGGCGGRLLTALTPRVSASVDVRRSPLPREEGYRLRRKIEIREEQLQEAAERIACLRMRNDSIARKNQEVAEAEKRCLDEREHERTEYIGRMCTQTAQAFASRQTLMTALTDAKQGDHQLLVEVDTLIDS
eukprot:4334413-Prymnesium_polylepis.1